jgi:hypothetical protein
MFYVYGLIDPDTGLISYIGYTSKAPAERLVGHLIGALQRQGDKNLWLLNLLYTNKTPFVVTLQMCETEEVARVAERWWIAHGQMVGWPLHNDLNTVKPNRMRNYTQADNAMKLLDHALNSQQLSPTPFADGMTGMRRTLPDRPPTHEERQYLRRLYEESGSKRAALKIAYGSVVSEDGYTPKTRRWLNEALAEVIA